MLTEYQIEALKKKLDERLDELCEEVRRELLDTEDQTYIKLAGQVHDIGEESVADLLVDLQLKEIERHIEEIKGIEAAFSRIASAKFGVCIDCQVTMELERLEAYPIAKRCHRCQENHERIYAGINRSSM